MKPVVMTQNTNDVHEFIERITHERKRSEAYQILALFEDVTSLSATMWGPSIIGFGSYHYVYESGREGDSPRVAFSPRLSKMTFYLGYDSDQRQAFLDRLGKYTQSKACIYVNKLADINLDVLRELIAFSFNNSSES